MTQVKTLLADARLPRLEVRMLLEHVLQKPRAWLLAHDTDPLPAAAQQAYEDLARRRLAGEPMAYLVGRREFMGHLFPRHARRADSASGHRGAGRNRAAMPGRPVRAGGAGPGHRQRRDRDLDRAGPARRARDGQRPESGRAGRGRRQRLGTGGLGALCRRQLVRRRAGRRGLRADRLQPALRGQRRSAPATGRRALRAARR